MYRYDHHQEEIQRRWDKFRGVECEPEYSSKPLTEESKKSLRRPRRAQRFWQWLHDERERATCFWITVATLLTIIIVASCVAVMMRTEMIACNLVVMDDIIVFAALFGGLCIANLIWTFIVWRVKS